MKIMIAEDSESVRFALRLAVEALGHEVIGLAKNGREALAQYPQKHPDLVIMDVVMPEMDGLSCTTLLREQDPTARVLIVTGSRTSDRDAQQAGARACLAKPFELAELNEMMQFAAA